MKQIVRWLAALMFLVVMTGCTLFGIGGGGEETPTGGSGTDPGGQTTDGGQAGPSLTLNASATSFNVGDQVTMTGQAVNLGTPQFSLQLVNPAAGDSPPTTYTILYNASLPEAAVDSVTGLQLVSATATNDAVTYVFRATAPGSVTASLTASGETITGDGAFVQANASAPPITLTVNTPPASQAAVAGVTLSASSTQVGVNNQFRLDVASVGVGAVQYTVTLTNSNDTANPASIILGATAPETPATSLVKVTAAQSEYISGTQGTGYVVLQTLGEGTLTATVTASGEAASPDDPTLFVPATVQSEPVTVTISQTFNASLALNASASSLAVGEEVTITAATTGLVSTGYSLEIINSQSPDLAARTFTVSVLTAPSLGPQEDDSRYPLQLVSASATDEQATFVLKASSAGSVIVRVSASSGVGSQGLGAATASPAEVTITVGGTGGAGTAGTSGTSGTRKYTVKAGDTLWSISRAAGTTIAEVVRLNSATYPSLTDDINSIQAGWVLNLPGAGGTGGAGTGSAGGTRYTIKAGDNLYRIGLQFNMLWTRIANANNLQPPYALTPGDDLIIP